VTASKLKLDIAALTDVGRKRKLNEDHYYFNQDLGLLVVADGMGGHNAGEVASEEAVNSISRYIACQAEDVVDNGYELGQAFTLTAKVRVHGEYTEQLESIVHEAVCHANETIYRLNRNQGFPDGTGMGTTVSGIWFPDNSPCGAIFHVGDSRVYVLSAGNLTQLTKDHTLHQQWLDEGCVGAEPSRNIVLRAVGPWPSVEVDAFSHHFHPDDMILVCSDGLTGMLADEEITRILLADSDVPVGTLAGRLVGAANQRGGVDNITVVLGKVA
jgi:protein phosphatase